MNFNILNLFPGNGSDGHGHNKPIPPVQKVMRSLGIMLMSALFLACKKDNEPMPMNVEPTIEVQTFSVAENSAPGTIVGTVMATDANGDSLTFTITDGNTANAFDINMVTGVITVKGTLDHEITQLYMLEVGVSDGLLTANANITINVTDVKSGTRLPEKDTDLAMENDNPYSIWSDKTTMWVADDTDYKLYAYTLATSTRDAAKEFDLTEENDKPTGLWSDGTTMWVTDEGDEELYAYTLATGMRNTAKEFDLTEENDKPTGLWSDGTTMWVTDEGDEKLYTYTLATGMRNTAKEFDLTEENDKPTGLWSDGTTMWVTDESDKKLYAYTLATGMRNTAKEFDLTEENESPRGFWSNGTALWVSDDGYDPALGESVRNAKIYAYQLK